MSSPVDHASLRNSDDEFQANKPSLYTPGVTLSSSSTATPIPNRRSTNAVQDVLRDGTDSSIQISRSSVHIVPSQTSASQGLQSPHELSKTSGGFFRNLRDASSQPPDAELDLVYAELDDTFSFQKLDKVLILIMKFPALTYQPNAKLALILSSYSNQDYSIQMPYIDLKSMDDMNFIRLPVIQVNSHLLNGLSSAYIRMLLNLPKGRLEQIERLHVQLFDEDSGHLASRARDSFESAIEHLSFALRNVTTLVVTMASRRIHCKRTDSKKSSHRFEFDLTRSKDRKSALLSVMRKLPYQCSNSGVLLTCLKDFTHKSFKCTLKNALVCVGVPPSSIFKEFLSYPNIHWNFEGSRTAMADGEMQQLAGFTSTENDPKPMDVSDYPFLNFLTGRGDIFAPENFPLYSLVSLEWTLNSSCGSGNVFDLNLPNLQSLLLNDACHTFIGTIIVNHYPKLLELQLENFGNKTVIDLADRAVRLLKVSLINFSGVFARSGRLSIAQLSVDENIPPWLLTHLGHHSASTEITLNSQRPRNGVHEESLFIGLRNLKLVNIERSFSYFTFQDDSRISVLETLTINYGRLSISPTMFPNLKNLKLEQCSVSFYIPANGTYGILDFRELHSLSSYCSTFLDGPDSVTERKQNQYGIERTCYYFHASKLKYLSLDVIQNHAWLIFSSKFCPLLEEINWRHSDPRGTELPFDNSALEPVLFSRLRTLSVDVTILGGSSKEKYLEILFPLARVNVLALRGSVIVPHFHEMRLACRYASFNLEFLQLNLQNAVQRMIQDYSRKSFRVFGESKDEILWKAIRATLFTIFPNVEAMICNGTAMKLPNRKMDEKPQPKNAVRQKSVREILNESWDKWNSMFK